MTPVSAVIITFNEEKNIERCLISLKNIADEIVVVDSFSTDGTERICRNYEARFIQHAFEGHIEQKNFALTQAKFQHVFSIDADESLSEQLQQSVMQVKSNWQYDGYVMNRLTNFCGEWIRYSGWYPDRKLRLFDRTKGKWGGINPHDKFEIKGSRIGFLKGDLLHYTAETEEDYLKKMDRYTDIASAELWKRNKSVSLPVIYIKAAVTFLRNYVLRSGILHGYMGLRLSTIGASYTYQKYAKLRKLRRLKN